MAKLGIFVLFAVAFGFLLAVRSFSENRSMDEAEYFLGKLDSSQLQKVVQPFDGDARETWHYVPGQRIGLPLKSFDEGQKKAAFELLKASLSESGYTKARAIQTDVESTLRDMEKNPGRDTELYYVTFFGKPAPKGSWGWRFEGHHLSFNFTFRDGAIVSTTPQFLGSNPAEVRQGPHKGLRVLAKEEDLGRLLVHSLTIPQREAAILSSQAPADLITTNQRQVAILKDRGLAYAKMSVDQQKLLKTLVQEYADVQKPDQAKSRMKRIQDAGWEKVEFAWMGGLESGQGHYYRIQGPTFLIEYDNTQNNANHIHSVWRDFKGDFGRDVLADHYNNSPRHQHRR